MNKLQIVEQPFITPSGKKLDGVELIVSCPLWVCNVNVKKNCSRCLSKEKISYKDKYVLCKYGRK